MDFFLGVDAGGTKTRAIIVSRDGVVRGRGEAGPGNWQAVGVAAAIAEVERAVVQALAGAGVAASAVGGSFFGLAGVRTETEREPLRAELARLGLGGVLEVDGDLASAHAGALGGGPGVVVIAGTGSAAWGKNAAGERWQSGGWGWLVDDAGGASWLAKRGLRAACEAQDGRGPESGLGARAATYFGQAGVREILRELHTGRIDRAGLAGFAREVREAAASDAVAAACVREAGEELLRLAEAVRGRLAPRGTAEHAGFPLAVTGGLGMGEIIRARAAAAGFAPTEPLGEPVAGAALLAARAAGVELDAGARVRLLDACKTKG